MGQLFLIFLQTVVAPEIVKLFADRAAAGLPAPTSDEVIDVFNSHIDQKTAEGVAFLLSKQTPPTA